MAGRILGRVFRSVVFISACFILSQNVMASDLPSDKGEASIIIDGPRQYYGGFSARGLFGHLERDGSSFFKTLKKENQLLNVTDPKFVTFSNDESFTGFEGEVFIGRRFGNRTIEFFLGGTSVSSDTSAYGSIENEDGQQNVDYFYLSAPKVGDGRTFTWVETNQFDVNDFNYRNDYDRHEFALGIRPTFYFGEPAPSLKDWSLKDTPAPAPTARRVIQPMAFLTFGRVDVDEHFSGFTDNDPKDEGTDIDGFAGTPGNIAFAYDNDIKSDFWSVGLGLSMRGPLARSGERVMGYFANVKGAAEFHDAKGTASWSYDQIGPDNFGVIGCPGNPIGAYADDCKDFTSNGAPGVSSKKSLSTDETAYSLLLEAGLTFSLAKGIDLEVGGRYRYTEAPQVVINGINDAYIAFKGAEEIGGFAGIKAVF